jgi:Protein of unknown function (DUF2752)
VTGRTLKRPAQPDLQRLGLLRNQGLAIVLPPLSDDRSTASRGQSALTWKVRLALLVVVAGLVGVFAVAAWVNPYDDEGKPYRWETHRQLGLPECTFKTLTGKPCPSCGMTTSFALLLRGDVVNSARANAVGTLLAVFLLLMIPWGLTSIVRGRLVFITSLERAITWAVAFFLTLLLLRWAIVLI